MFHALNPPLHFARSVLFSSNHVLFPSKHVCAVFHARIFISPADTNTPTCPLWSTAFPYDWFQIKVHSDRIHDRHNFTLNHYQHTGRPRLDQLPDDVLDCILGNVDAGSLRNVLLLHNRRLHDRAKDVCERIGELILRSWNNWYPRLPGDTNNEQQLSMFKAVAWKRHLNPGKVNAKWRVDQLRQMIDRPYDRRMEPQYRQNIGDLLNFLLEVCMPQEPQLMYPRLTGQQRPPSPPPGLCLSIEQEVNSFDIPASVQIVHRWLESVFPNQRTYMPSSDICQWMFYIYTRSSILKTLVPNITHLSLHCIRDPDNPLKRAWKQMPHFEGLNILSVRTMRRTDMLPMLKFMSEHQHVRQLTLEGLKPDHWPARLIQRNDPIIHEMRQLQNEGMNAVEWQKPLLLPPLRMLSVQALVINNCTFLSNETMQQLMDCLPRLTYLCVDGKTVERLDRRHAQHLGFDPRRLGQPFTLHVNHRQQKSYSTFKCFSLLIMLFIFVIFVLNKIFRWIIAHLLK